MKKVIILLSVVFLFSCTQEEVITEFQEQVKLSEVNLPQTPKHRTFKLYKESYLNQRSGISFTYHHQFPYPWEYMPKMGNENPTRGWYGGGQAYGDINNDGYQDILVSYHKSMNDISMVWFLNKGDNQNFYEDKTKKYFNNSTSGVAAYKLLKTDVNNDNIPDYICLGVIEIPGNYGGNFSVLIGKSDNTFDVSTIQTKQRYWYHNGAAGDLNGDGNVDIITATFIWWGDGTGKFTQGISFDDSNLSYVNSPIVYEIIDINKDGYNDMVLSTVSQLGVTTIIFGKQGGFDNTNQIIKLPKSSYNDILDIEFNDLDGDGDLDIIELRHIGGAPDGIFDPKYSISKLMVYWNDNFKFRLDEDYFSESADGDYQHGQYDQLGWSTFKFDDIDNDGQDEIVTENYHDGTYNGLKKINGVWKKHIIKFGK